MTRLIVRLLLLCAAAAFFAWIADRPGTIVVRWFNREIETSVLAGLAGVILLVAAFLFVIAVLRRIFGAPGALGTWFRFRRTRQGYEALSRGIIAAGAGDALAASRFAKVATRTLHDEPLLKLLEVQAAQLKGDRPRVRRGFEDMLKSPETELLGLRGLFTEARLAGDLETGRTLAERALKINPALGWAGSAMLAIQSAAGQWDKSLATLEAQRKAGQIDLTEARRKRAVLLTAQAMTLEETERDRALGLASEAHKLDPALVPAAVVAARIHAHRGVTRKVWRVVKRSWAAAPHPDLAEIFAHARPGSSPLERYERVRQLLKIRDGDLEGKYARARAAIEAQKWDEAQGIIDALAPGERQARFCVLMATLFDERDNDKGRAREWLARAMQAPRDPMWVADGQALPRWTPVSPATGEIVICEWKVPFAVELIEEPAPAPVEPPPAVDLEPDPVPPPRIEAPPPPRKIEVIEAPPSPAPPLPQSLPQPPQRPVMVEPIRPPDDPGPLDGDDDNQPRRIAADG
ncbi:heme biosynthesis protein HemY [soil metagenome]